MNRCSSSHGSLYGPCSCCGYFQAPANSFSMFFMDDPYASSSSSSVDCTLSLGTPSTRQSSTSYNFSDHHPRASTSSNSGSKKLSWDIFHSKKSSSSSSASKTSRSNGNAGNGNGDSLLARRCANCDTTSTPLWRNGPRGPKSLCNACGIRYKKEERRAANSSSTSTSTTSSNATMMESHSYMGMGHQQWGHQGNEFRFIEDNDGDSTTDTAIPFLSWRLNVPVHDYS